MMQVINERGKKFKEYKGMILRTVLLAAIILAFLFAWDKTLFFFLNRTNTVSYALEKFKREGRRLEDNVFISKDNKYYLLNKDIHSPDFIVAGPYTWIAADDYDNATHIERYRSTNGLIGFVDESGNEITPAIYQEASCFSDGEAAVTDKEGNQYRIDTKGRKIR